MATFSVEKIPVNPSVFICEICDLTTRNKKDYKKHLITAKHIKSTQINTNILNIPNIPNIIESTENLEKKHLCLCGKIYSDRSGLWRHKTKCISTPNNINMSIHEIDNKETDIIENTNELHNNSNLILEILKQNQEFKEMILEKPIPADTNDSLIIELLKQNQDFKDLMIEQNKYMMEQSKQMMELAKNAGNHNNNTTNNKFNMQIFLNETCKDAMNITEFVNSLVLTFKDLEDLGRYGYTQGITNIFTRGLQATEISKRPIHCSDMKRLIIYINDVNGWEKDNSSQEKVVQLIRKIAGKNLRQATEWMRINHSMIHGPDSYEQRQYLKMISQWFGGTDEENVKIYNKIIRNIAPQCYIDKYPALK